MKFCGHVACGDRNSYFGTERFCKSCGVALREALRCRCGVGINPNHEIWLQTPPAAQPPNHCTQCGQIWDGNFLQELYVADLKPMLLEIRKQLRELHVIS